MTTGAISDKRLLVNRWFYGLICIYFLFLSAELLNFQVYLYKIKAGHLIAVGVFCIFLALKNKIFLERSFFGPALAIFSSLFLSAILGAHPFRCLGYLSIYLFNFLCYFVLPYNILIYFGLSVLRLYFFSFIVIGIYAVLQLSLSLFGVDDPFASQRVSFIARGQALAYEPSYYALYMTLFVMYYNAKALLSKAPEFSWIKWLCVNLLLLASTSTGVFFSYPVFGLVLFTTSILFSYPLAKKKIFLFLLSFLIFLCSVYWLSPELILLSILKFFYLGFEHGSFAARWEGICHSFTVFTQNPWFGVGLGGIGPYLFKQHFNCGNEIESLSEAEMFDPTNTLTEVLGSLGIFGFAAFSWLAVQFARSFKEVMNSAYIEQKNKISALSFFISVVVGIIVLQFNSGLFRPYIWVHIALASAYFYKIKNPLNCKV